MTKSLRKLNKEAKLACVIVSVVYIIVVITLSVLYFASK